MKHKVFLNEKRIIEVILDGPIDASEVIELGKAVVDIELNQLEKEQLLVLVRIENNPGLLSPQAMKSNFMVYRDIPYSKLAFVAPIDGEYFGGEAKILQGAGKDPASQNIGMFNSTEEATAWLLSA